MSRLTIAGIGPGDRDSMTIAVDKALQAADVIIGYTVYIDLIKPCYPGKEYLSTPMTKEADRCRMALDLARQGLSARGMNEECFLDPLYDRLNRKSNPAMDMLRMLEEGKSIEDVILLYR